MGGAVGDAGYTERIESASFGLAEVPGAPDVVRGGFCDRLLQRGEGPIDDVAFMNAVLELLRALLQPRLMFLGLLTNDGRSVTTCLVIEDGKRAKDFTYALADSPCATVLGPQAMCIYPEDVAALFPLDYALQRLKAQGYVGMPLLARDGRQIGIIGAVTAHAIRDLDAVRSALRIFGRRLSLELERTISDADAAEEIAEAIRREEQQLAVAMREVS